MVKVKEVTLWVGGVDKNTPQVRFIRTNKTTKGRSHVSFSLPLRVWIAQSRAQNQTGLQFSKTLQRLKLTGSSAEAPGSFFYPTAHRFNLNRIFYRIRKIPITNLIMRRAGLSIQYLQMLSGGQNLNLPDFFFFTQILLWARLPVTLWLESDCNLIAAFFPPLSVFLLLFEALQFSFKE